MYVDHWRILPFRTIHELVVVLCWPTPNRKIWVKVRSRIIITIEEKMITKHDPNHQPAIYPYIIYPIYPIYFRQSTSTRFITLGHCSCHTMGVNLSIPKAATVATSPTFSLPRRSQATDTLLPLTLVTWSTSKKKCWRFAGQHGISWGFYGQHESRWYRGNMLLFQWDFMGFYGPNGIFGMLMGWFFIRSNTLRSHGSMGGEALRPLG